MTERRVRLPWKDFNRKFRPLLLEEDHRYLVLCGGAGSGKSFFAAQRFLYRLLAKPLCDLLVVRAAANTHRDSTYALFRQVIRQWGLEDLFTCRETEPRILCANGNSVVFRGLGDREQLKSLTFPRGELTDVWVEEASQIQEADFNQLDVRLRGGESRKQMVLTFNPVSAVHWLKRRFFDREDPRALVLRSTYRDNDFLDPDYAATLESYKDTDPYYYGVYCLGEWGVLGQSYFDQKAVTQRLGELDPPLDQGEFVWNGDPDSLPTWAPGSGPVKVYKRPEPGGRYLVGVDTAGEGSDYGVAQVVSAVTGEQVCVLRGRLEEDLFAQQVYCLGRHYHDALVAVEVNFSTYPARELERLGYPFLYRRREEGATRGKLGFLTTSGNRPLLLGRLAAFVRQTPELLRDRDTLEEMLTFVRNARGRPEAESGAHDDCVMALGIALEVREQGGWAEPAGGFPALTVTRS